MFLNLIFLCLVKLSIAEKNCGVSSHSDLTNNLHFPWITEILSNINKTADNLNDLRICGSTIITSLFSITAAHCIQQKHSKYKRSPNEIYLLANVVDLMNTNASQRIGLIDIKLHPDWNAESPIFNGDIALMKFITSIEFNDKISPICLWHMHSELIDHGKILSFISLEEDSPGYYNHFHDEFHNYPKEFNVPIRSECVRSQPRFMEIYSNRSFCGGGLNSGPCLETGNSGSSLAVQIDGIFHLRGIVSASFIDIAGCDNYTYTLFTDVLKYKDWIDGITKLH